MKQSNAPRFAVLVMDINRKNIINENFPYGPYGIQFWLDNFNIIKVSYEMLSHHEDLTDDLDDYINHLKQEDKNFYNRFDYNMLISRTKSLFIKLIPKVKSIESLLKLRESYSIKNRIPNIFWICILFFISFIMGIIMPLIFIALNKESAPITVNIIFMLLSFIPLGGILYLSLSRSDLKTFEKKELAYEYIKPLKDQLNKFHTDEHQYLAFNYDILNRILAESNATSQLPKKLLRLANDYRKIVIECNNLSYDLVLKLTDDLKKNSLTSNHLDKTNSGGTLILLFRLLENPDQIKLEGNKIYIFNLISDSTSRDHLKITTPSDLAGLTSLTNEIKSIIKEELQKKETQDCLRKRSELRKIRTELIIYLEKEYAL